MTRDVLEREARAAGVEMAVVEEVAARRGIGSARDAGIVYFGSDTERHHAIRAARRARGEDETPQYLAPRDVPAWLERARKQPATKAALRCALRRMPRDMQRAVVLHLWRARTHRETAEAIGVPFDCFFEGRLRSSRHLWVQPETAPERLGSGAASERREEAAA